MAKFRRLLVVLSGPLLAAGLAGGVAAWWHHTTSPDYRLRRGREALAREDWDGAERLALVLEADGAPDHARLLRAEALFGKAKPLLDAGREAAAAPLLRRALDGCNGVRDRGELRLQAAALSGKCLLYLKQPAAAERALEFVLRSRPDDAEAHRGLAAIYYDQGAMSRAMGHLEEAARLDPPDGRPHRMMGHIYKYLDRHDRAIDCFREALRRRLGGAFAEDARKDLAECLVKRSLHAEALQTLDACTEQTRREPRCVALRAECLAARGDGAGARALLDVALADHPRSPELLRLRARLHQEARELKAAAGLLERAVAVDGHDYPARYQLALVYAALGREAAAQEQRRLCRRTKDLLIEMTRLNEAANASPWDADVRHRLAEVCRQLGRPDQAKVWEAAATACGPDAPRP